MMVHQKAGRKLDGLGLTYLETLWDNNGFNPIVKSFWLLYLMSCAFEESKNLMEQVMPNSVPEAPRN